MSTTSPIHNCWQIKLCGIITLLISMLPLQIAAANDPTRPNILWITSEDNGPELGCYGDTYADTPNIDSLAEQGTRFMNCWSNAPVCAPARTTIISGMWPTSLGAQHMRSEVPLPDGLQLYPESLKSAGYFCTNRVKTDYNLTVDVQQLWDQCNWKAHWRNRPADSPFFSVFNLTISHESKLRTRPHTAIHNPADSSLPPFYPDLPDIRRDWAQYYDRVTEMDKQVGEILNQLDQDGLTENTIVFYYGDHGTGMPRGKRWLYQTGLHVPLVIRVPEKWRTLAGIDCQSGSQNDELVGFIDLAPTVLSLTGAHIPPMYQGRAFLGPARTPEPEYMYGFRDRMDEVYDCSRAVRTRKFLYIRNWKPHRAQGEYLDYMFKTPTTRVWKQAFQSGSLNATQSVFWLPKPSEELYDLRNDPFQIKNLADDPNHQQQLEQLREAHRNWTLETNDTGLLPEALMLELSAGQSPLNLAYDAAKFPISQIYDAADIATRDPLATSTDLDRLLESDNAAIRYWGAIGYLVRCTRNELSPTPALLKATSDESPVTRAVACETVARFSDQNDTRLTAIENLIKLADQRNCDYFSAVEALNALVHCHPKSHEIGSEFSDFPVDHGSWPERYKPYIRDLLKRLADVSENDDTHDE